MLGKDAAMPVDDDTEDPIPFPVVHRPVYGAAGQAKGVSMPLTSLGSYLTTAQAFIAHWTSVNATLGANPLKLKSTYAVSDFTADRAALQTAITALEPSFNALQAAVRDRDLKKAAIKPRVLQFRNAVRFYLQGQPIENSLPVQPALSAIESKFLKPLDDTASLWALVNAIPATGVGSVPGFTPPLTLLGAYPIATLTTDIAALRAAYLAVSNAQVNLKIVREKRDALLPNLRARMEQYRKAILALYAPTDPFVMSLPTLTAPSGSTPDPVSVSGKWDAALGKGVLTILPSDDPKLDYYSVRIGIAPTYKASEETVIGRIEKGETTFETTTGLAASGSVGLFKVYVVLTTGNEKGSATVKITRT